MNNLYHRFAIASIGIALSLALATDKQAKAATITLIPLLQFSTIDQGNGLGDSYSGLPYGVRSLPVGTFNYGEVKATYEFNIGNLSLAPNTVIKSARFNAIIRDSRRSPGGSFFVSLSGYAGNGRPDASDFETGELLRSEAVSFGGG